MKNLKNIFLPICLLGLTLSLTATANLIWQPPKMVKSNTGNITKTKNYHKTPHGIIEIPKKFSELNKNEKLKVINLRKKSGSHDPKHPPVEILNRSEIRHISSIRTRQLKTAKH